VYTEEDVVAIAQGCDYSFSRPDPACLHASGIRFAVRYTSIGQSAKNMTSEEVRALVAAGIAVVTVFEETAGHMLGGHAAGVAAARASVELAEQCGMPDGRPHYYALDVDPNHLSVQQWRAVMDYLDGAASVHGKAATGVYAGFRGIEELVPAWAPWGWQTFAWSDGRWSAKAVLQQYRNGVTRCGGQIDLDQALAADYGQWGLKEEDVPLTDEDIRKVAGAVDKQVLELLRAGFGGLVPGSENATVRASQGYLFGQVAAQASRLTAVENQLGVAGTALREIVDLLQRVEGADPQTIAKAVNDDHAARMAPRPPS
jgi:hypothetical protein